VHGMKPEHSALFGERRQGSYRHSHALR
jgi:hypothetical protein